jgi:hypothetical protein
LFLRKNVFRYNPHPKQLEFLNRKTTLLWVGGHPTAYIEKETTMDYPTVYCAPDNEKPNVWRTHWLTAIADIRSEGKLTVDQAELLLRQSTSDMPVRLKECEYWIVTQGEK